jgi:hypothetical protein
MPTQDCRTGVLREGHGGRITGEQECIDKRAFPTLGEVVESAFS